MKPLLAETATRPALLPFPLYASPKFDGIRCLIVNGQAVSRKLKPIRNAHIQAELQKLGALLEGMDGELITFTDGVRDEYCDVNSKVMSGDGVPEFKFFVFDRWNEAGMSYELRDCINYETIGEEISGTAPIEHVRQETIKDVEALDAYEATQLALGYEGVMVRRKDALYKFGRSTEKEAILLKVKRFEDGEAIVEGFEELMHNANAATKDALGATERSMHRAGMVGRNALGALSVRRNGQAFAIGTGFTQARREALWKDRASLVGRVVKFKFQPSGMKDAPRFPVFLGFRDADDL